MESYIIRIYRRDESDPQKIVGIVEFVETQGQQAFKGFDELREILNSPVERHSTGDARNTKTRRKRSA